MTQDNGAYARQVCPYEPTPLDLRFVEESPLRESGDLIQTRHPQFREAVESIAEGEPHVAKSLKPVDTGLCRRAARELGDFAQLCIDQQEFAIVAEAGIEPARWLPTTGF